MIVFRYANKLYIGLHCFSTVHCYKSEKVGLISGMDNIVDKSILAILDR